MSGALELSQLLTAPISKVLDGWFESEPLKATLGTDGVIGLMGSPRGAGTGYVLLHHVLGGLDGVSGAWAFVYGGMGAVSDAIASAARAAGAQLETEKEVSEILVSSDGSAEGVRLRSGTTIAAPLVFSNATPQVTFCSLTPQVRLLSSCRPDSKSHRARQRRPDLSKLAAVGRAEDEGSGEAAG